MKHLLYLPLAATLLAVGALRAQAPIDPAQLEVNLSATCSTYWLVSYAGTAGFGTWLPLERVFSTDPVVTACSDGSIYIIGKDATTHCGAATIYQPRDSRVGSTGRASSMANLPQLGRDNAVYIAAEVLPTPIGSPAWPAIHGRDGFTGAPVTEPRRV